jgi:hypothetical protein
MELSWTLFKEGLRILRHNLHKKSFREYEGDAVAICRQIVEDCWNGTYFKAGATHLDQFWIRDLGWCIRDLKRLGYQDRLRENLAWVLGVYRGNQRVTTTVFHMKKAHDIFVYASDSMPFLLFCLNEAGASDLTAMYADFLNDEARRYRRNLLDEETGRARRDRYFSAAKDVMQYKSTCYTHVFMQWMKEQCRRTGGLVEDPFVDLDFSDVILANYWTGEFFRNDDESDEALLSADANVWPFWTGVVTDGEKMLKAFAALEREGLTDPFPIKYHRDLERSRVVNLPRLMIPNYQGNSIWTLLGPLYIELLARIDRGKARKHLNAYTEQIERWRTYVEVFEPDGTGPLKGRFGHGSEAGMLWACMYLGLREDLDDGCRGGGK